MDLVTDTARRARELGDAEIRRRLEADIAAVEERARLRAPLPESTVSRGDLETAVNGALLGRMDQIEHALRELAHGLRDELLASRVRELAARLGPTPAQEEILQAWGEILFVLELEDEGRPSPAKGGSDGRTA